MAASARATVLRAKSKAVLKPKRGLVAAGVKGTASGKKKQPLYRTKLRGKKRKKAPGYDSCSDEEDVAVQEEEETGGEDLVVPEKEKDSDSEDEAYDEGNEGWADVMTSILNSGKGKKSVILSRALTDRELEIKRAVKQEEFEVEQAGKEAGEGADGEAVAARKAKPQPASFKEMKKNIVARREEKKNWESMGRVKPDITARQKERALQRIATKGIVHLFNAVKQRQSTIETKMKEVHGSEVKRDKILKSMTKGEFLDVLKSKAKSIAVEDAVAPLNSMSTARKSSAEPKPRWNVFRDDYMIGATMKDWDKESDSEAEGGPDKSGPAQDVDVSSSDED